MTTATHDREARTVEQLDALVLHWSGGGRAHRVGCSFLGTPAVSGDIRAAALALRRPCGICFTGSDLARLERRFDDALAVAVSRSCTGGLRLPVGLSWEEVHREAQRVRLLAVEAERIDLGDGDSECECGLDVIGECICGDTELPW